MAVRLTTSAEATAVKKPDTTSAGVYTTEQAAAGEKTYYARCSMCHGDDLAGIERAPALAGSQFLDSWNGKDLRRLLDRVLTMPPGDPKPPTNAEAAELLAFLLRTADMPSGSTALPADRSRLAEIMFERKP
jgi:mono/diheme cytochrome c family protein